MSPTGDLLVTLIFVVGRCPRELAQGPSRVALAWHKAGRSTPFGVTLSLFLTDPNIVCALAQHGVAEVLSSPRAALEDPRSDLAAPSLVFPQPSGSIPVTIKNR